jgi:DNA anti-recombination protein RmuC
MNTTQLVLSLLGSAGLPLIVTALVKALESRKALKASAPRADAEAVDIGITAQGKALANLTTENARLTTRADRADAKVEAVEARGDAREVRMYKTLEDARLEFENRIKEMQASFDQKIGQIHQENVDFRQRVELLLVENKVALPPWFTVVGGR